MLAVLGVLVALNALFIFALLWAYLVLVVGVVAGGFVYLQTGEFSYNLLQAPVSWPTYLGILAVFLGGQMYYGYQRVLKGTRGATGRDEHAVADRVRRLAMTVDVPEPDVRVVDDETPSCYTVGRFTDATIVVTTGLIEKLDVDELEGVLAHEIAHIANRDVTLMTITTLFLEIADRAYHSARLARRALSDSSQLSESSQNLFLWFGPFIVLTYVFVSPILSIFPTVADWATRTLSHAREFAADEAAARTTGKPLALATALMTLDETSPTPETDLRTTRTSALCVVPTSMVRGPKTRQVPEPEQPAESLERESEVSVWLEKTPPAETASMTHPPVEQRIERLQTLAAQLEEI